MTAAAAKKAERRIDQATEVLLAHGYVVTGQPLSGSEETYADTLWTAVRRVEATVFFNAGRYGYRGLSKTALTALHESLPAPAFGVEVASFNTQLVRA